MELYTVREAANVLNVAVQSIYTKIERAEKDNPEKYVVIGSDKLKRVTSDFMLDYYGYTGEAAEAKQNADKETISFLQAELERERERSAAERERLTADNDKLHAEIERLHTEIAQLIQMNMNNQTLLLMEKKPADPDGTADGPEATDGEQVKKKGFFSIFGRGKE